jgi:antitoxin component YwqK of YwqJK toxin-antitoxin module
LAVGQSRNDRAVSFVMFYETGEISAVRIPIADSSREIGWHWHRNRRPSIYADWEKGELNGVFRTWFPDGRPQSEGRFAAGEFDVIWKYWKPDGSPPRVVDHTRHEPPPARIAP